MTVIWINIMITTSTNSKQDNIFDCCQGLQFDHIFIFGAKVKLEKNHFTLEVFLYVFNFYAVLHGDYLF